MKFRSIGSLSVSVVGLGCNNFGMRINAEKSGWVMHAAIESGINFFDTSDVYGDGESETILGGFLVDRADVLVATKFGYSREHPAIGDGSPPNVRRSLEGSLRRLRRDWVDLYQMHRPDPRVPISETLEVLTDLKRKGLIREFGCSGVTQVHIDAAESASRQYYDIESFCSVQNEYSLLARDVESSVLPRCREYGLAFLPFFPLADGLLSGKYRKGQPPPLGSRLDDYSPAMNRRSLAGEEMDLVESLDDFARQHGHTLNELAIAWLAAQPTLASIIAGATKPEQVVANAASSEWHLSEAELSEIDKLLAPQPA